VSSNVSHCLFPRLIVINHYYSYLAMRILTGGKAAGTEDTENEKGAPPHGLSSNQVQDDDVRISIIGPR
jgi:hypothetical protein